MDRLFDTLNISIKSRMERQQQFKEYAIQELQSIMQQLSVKASKPATGSDGVAITKETLNDIKTRIEAATYSLNNMPNVFDQDQPMRGGKNSRRSRRKSRR